MLHDTPLKALDILADRAKPPVDGVFDEFNGGVPTAGEWQIQHAKVTGKPADQDIFRKRFPEAVDTADQ
ncbi:hypothetical protein H0H93_010631 [Arthromyces matolae]|nr:hypothetical protein H0H93_010631 [Arthromyces matolae]